MAAAILGLVLGLRPDPGSGIVRPMLQFDVPSLKFVILYGCEGFAFLVIAFYSGVRLKTGTWAVLGLAGALVGAIPALLWSAGWAQVRWAEDTGIFDFVNRHEPLVQLDWSRPLAVALLAGALITARRASLRPGEP